MAMLPCQMREATRRLQMRFITRGKGTASPS